MQDVNPGQENLKHMIDSEMFFVYGHFIDHAGQYISTPLAITAISDEYKENELVDTMFVSGSDAHYSLDVPAGTYNLLIFSDIDGNGVFNSSEVIGKHKIVLSKAIAPDKVLIQADINLTTPTPITWKMSIKVPKIKKRSNSLSLPSGVILDLSDPIFDRSYSTLGLYDPAAFLEMTPTMFYALEEDSSYKIPIVFVHGISGSARDFQNIVERLDRHRYKPWFFYYPSGGDLGWLSELFYQAFLSGESVQLKGIPMIIIAHSMGGLIVREAINKYQGELSENRARLLITLATPFGGHFAAAAGEERSLIVLPSWRDLNPKNTFIKNLYRKPLPKFMRHDLLFAYGNSNKIKVGDNSDGVISLSSQLYFPAQFQANERFGFNNSHVGILKDEDVIAHILTRINMIKSIVPSSH